MKRSDVRLEMLLTSAECYAEAKREADQDHAAVDVLGKHEARKQVVAYAIFYVDALREEEAELAKAEAKAERAAKPRKPRQKKDEDASKGEGEGQIDLIAQESTASVNGSSYASE